VPLLEETVGSLNAARIATELTAMEAELAVVLLGLAGRTGAGGQVEFSP
jgi:hypothetical protein